MKHIFIYIAVMILTLSACHHQKSTKEDKEVCDSTIAVSTDSQNSDSTLYGISDDFGMSTFSIVTTKGDTLYLTRTDSQGKDGMIYGSLRENDHYAVTTSDNNNAINVLINLTQLNKHVKDYSIRNGHLVINKDTVEIITLNDTVFDFK